CKGVAEVLVSLNEIIQFQVTQKGKQMLSSHVAVYLMKYKTFHLVIFAAFGWLAHSNNQRVFSLRTGPDTF
ncbi:MAG: hypothetical protein WCB68_20475, partial [Pyrinomonadaceae bacterium]